MQENNAMSLREILERIPTSQLDEMLRLELGKEAPDKNAVMLLLGILEEREADAPEEADAQAEAAWERYQKRIEEGIIRPKPTRNRRWAWWAVSAALLVFVLMAFIPQRADAEGFWGMLDRWKDSILEFFNSSERIKGLEHPFETDNPGMQMLYDAAVEAGIENPLIPMWFEEEYDMAVCKVVNSPTAHGVAAELTEGNKKAVLNVDVYEQKTFHGYWGEETYYKKYEQDGATYTITRNNDRWVAVWVKDNVEYSLTIDCREDTLMRILESIYGTEVQ